MIVAILTNLYPPYVRGGAEYLTHQLGLELVRQGHQVCVVTGVPWKSVRKFSPELREEGGVKVYRFFPLNFYHYLQASHAPYPLRFLWQLVNLANVPVARSVATVLKHEQPDLVISANLMGLSFLLPRTIAKLGLKHIHVLHDVQLLHPSGLFRWGKRRGGLVAWCYRALTRWLFKSVTTVVSPSRWLMDEHVNKGFFPKANHVVLPNPAPQPLAIPGTKTTKLPLRLLYVGQLEEHKGILWLLATLDKLPRQDFILHIFALGQKPKLKLVRELALRDNRFVLHDLPSQEEIDQAYAASHLTIVPSLCYENSPIAIPTSFRAQTPVLAANLGGIPELIIEGETGWLFAPGDSRDLVTKLSWCFDHPGKLLEAGLKASRVFADRTLEHYAKMLVDMSK